MEYKPLVISLPIADRAISHDFYRHALDLETIGELGDDGIPEPLQFVINPGVRVMFPPTVGFNYTIGRGEVAVSGHHECLLVLAATTPAEADALVDRAVSAGAAVVTPPAQQPWGYAGSFSDPDGHIWMVRADQDPPTS